MLVFIRKKFEECFCRNQTKLSILNPLLAVTIFSVQIAFYFRLSYIYYLSHGYECNMANILRVAHILQTYFTTEAVTEVFCKKRCSVRKGVLRNFAKFTGKHLCQSLFFNKVAGQACNFIKKETLAYGFSCEFYEISKNTFFTEHLWATAFLASL